MPVPGRPRNPNGEHSQRFHRQRVTGVASVNEHGETPDRIKQGPRAIIARRGASPGLMQTDTRGERQAFGTIRRVWRQAIAGTTGPPPFPVSRAPAIFTRGLRYKSSTLYRSAIGARFALSARAVQPKFNRGLPVTIAAGNVRGAPTVRNRLSSFGSRVPTLNEQSPDVAESAA